MNKELLNTIIVKISIKRYLELDYSIDEIRLKLEDIHLIILTNDDLGEFIKNQNVG